jgi:hypothetical protein
MKPTDLIGTTIFAHAEDYFLDENIDAVFDVQALAKDYEQFDEPEPFALITESRIITVIEITVEDDGVEVHGKIPRQAEGIGWFVIDGNRIEHVAETEDLLKSVEKSTTCYGVQDIGDAVYAYKNGALRRLTASTDVARARRCFRIHSGPVLQEKESRL